MRGVCRSQGLDMKSGLQLQVVPSFIQFRRFLFIHFESLHRIPVSLIPNMLQFRI